MADRHIVATRHKVECIHGWQRLVWQADVVERPVHCQGTHVGVHVKSVCGVFLVQDKVESKGPGFMPAQVTDRVRNIAM